jgi:hypothetical protein
MGHPVVVACRGSETSSPAGSLCRTALRATKCVCETQFPTAAGTGFAKSGDSGNCRVVG